MGCSEQALRTNQLEIYANKFRVSHESVSLFGRGRVRGPGNTGYIFMPREKRLEKAAIVFQENILMLILNEANGQESREKREGEELCIVEVSMFPFLENTCFQHVEFFRPRPTWHMVKKGTASIWCFCFVY